MWTKVPKNRLKGTVWAEVKAAGDEFEETVVELHWPGEMPRLMREGLVDQIARERGRRESNDVASALIEQMKVQLKLLVSFQQMMGMYLTAQIMINGPLYLVGRQVAVRNSATHRPARGLTS